MLVFAAQMRRSFHLIPEELQFLQLWYGDLQRLSDSPKARISRTLGRASDLFQKVGTEWVRRSTEVTIGLSHELRNQMKVSDRLKEFSKLPKLPADVHLLKMGLVQAVRISLVLR